MNDKNSESEEELKSKTDIKKEMQILQDIGISLLDVPEAVYKKLPVPEELDEAIQTYKRITSNNAKKRQRQYIGRIMRSIEVEPLQNAIREWQDGNKKLTREFHQMEQLRSELVEGNKESINLVLEKYPNCDRQQLMQLVRGAQKEHQAEQPGKNFKKLFQLLKSLAQKELQA